MKKLKLTEWAAVAEVVGTIGVMVSLVFVAFSINNNTEEVRASQTNYVYDTSRQIELMVAADPEWVSIVIKGRNHSEQLSEVEQYRYDAYLVANVDLWDAMLERHADGLINSFQLGGWDDYFIGWTERHIADSDWQRIKWQYRDYDIAQKIEAVLSAESIQ